MKLNSHHRLPNYGVGALAAFVLSLGFMVIVYGGGIIQFDPFNLPAWILGPLGVYTLIYSFVAGKDPLYYLVWGSVMFAIAVASALYKVINALIIFGMLMIVLTVIGLLAYWRKKG